MKKDSNIRNVDSKDELALWVMLMHAAQESSIDAVRTNSDCARYVEGWGRLGDVGVIAEIDGKPVGAAWLRLWTDCDRGYGYVDDETPELAIAVSPERRGQGIGTALLKQLLKVARPQFSGICLSTRADNPALRLYERFGFVRVVGTEVTNRAGSVSLTMRYPFNADS